MQNFAKALELALNLCPAGQKVTITASILVGDKKNPVFQIQSMKDIEIDPNEIEVKTDGNQFLITGKLNNAGSAITMSQPQKLNNDKPNKPKISSAEKVTKHYVRQLKKQLSWPVAAASELLGVPMNQLYDMVYNGTLKRDIESGAIRILSTSLIDLVEHRLIQNDGVTHRRSHIIKFNQKFLMEFIENNRDKILDKLTSCEKISTNEISKLFDGVSTGTMSGWFKNITPLSKEKPTDPLYYYTNDVIKVFSKKFPNLMIHDNNLTV